MDIFSAAKRSEIMSRIRSDGTRAEDRLYSLVRTILGGRRKVVRNETRILGSPDLFIPSLRLAIFLDGCFFHACPIHGHIPKSNTAYWEKKIAKNVARDKAYRATLRRRGVSVWRFWEHELRPASLDRALKRLNAAMRRLRVAQRGQTSNGSSEHSIHNSRPTPEGPRASQTLGTAIRTARVTPPLSRKRPKSR
jgi:DNA mismatch endonuclease (patch repair protein)